MAYKAITISADVIGRLFYVACCSQLITYYLASLSIGRETFLVMVETIYSMTQYSVVRFWRQFRIYIRFTQRSNYGNYA